MTVDTGMYTTLISAETLQQHLNDPDWVIVDCRFNLLATEAGRQAYREGHIPGARYAHLDEDLSSPVHADSGRHPLPDPERLAQRLGAWGISPSSQVVVYDDGPGTIAARLWWLLRWLGARRVALLDGGLSAWQAQGFALSTEEAQADPAVFQAQPDNSLWVATATVVNHLNDDRLVLVDARAGPRFRGEQEPIDPVAGHIPGALNYPNDRNLHNGHWRSAAELRQTFSALLGDTAAEQVVHMCGSGVSACQNLLAMEVAGLPGAKLYAGSWSEWIRDPARPLATGAD